MNPLLSPLLRNWSYLCQPTLNSPKHQSVKLSVTVKCHLESKYNPAALKQINTAIKRWKSADDKRGIQTVHVAVDDPEEMNAARRGAGFRRSYS